MKYLLDTQILLWALQNNPKLSQQAKNIISDKSNTLVFSSVSIWEVAIKLGNGYTDGLLDPIFFYKALLSEGFQELTVNSIHASEVLKLPLIHKDPFDRMLIAQSRIENLILMTVDDKIIKYDVNFLEV